MISYDQPNGENKMKLPSLFLSVIIILIFPAIEAQAAPISEPQNFFGFQPGSDRNLFTYEQLIDYLKKVETESDRIRLEQIGESPMGRPMYVALISSEKNISNLTRLKEINRMLALDPNIDESERTKIIAEGKVFVLATLSMHSGEVGPSQAAPLIVYDLLTTDDQVIRATLENVVFMMVPSHNPDGMDMIITHYKKYKGTKYEGSSMPGLYHKYVGHDNNRDFVTLSQSDTRAISRLTSTDWFPQVAVEKHQMGSTGPRYFVPPNHDPIAENIDARIWNWSGVFGANLIKEMTAHGLSGVSQHYLFDDYWPGSTTTNIWKNTIGFLTEAASVKYATPIYVEPNELKVYGKGLSEYKISTNMPLLWPGGWWRLGDIVEYERVSTMAILHTAARHRQQILQFRNDICKSEVNSGLNEGIRYFILPSDQKDQGELVNLVHLMLEHGVNVYQLKKDIDLGAARFSQGDVVIPMAQSFRPFIKEVMEKQKYPVRHYTPDGEIIKPYDITSWSLPLHRGLRVETIMTVESQVNENLDPLDQTYHLRSPAPAGYQAVILPVRNNESFELAFAAMAQGVSVRRATEDFSADGVKFAKGSFIISRQSELENLLGSLNVSPHFSGQVPGVKTQPVKLPRIALVESWFHDMDAGWTRFIMDAYHIPYKVLRPGDFPETNLSKNYDLIIFPDENKDILISGKWKSENDYYVSSYPPEFTRGIGEEGMKNLLGFIENGGKVISWGSSTSLFQGMLSLGKDKEEFRLPFDDISDDLAKQGLYCPGSFVRLKLTPDHPLTWGLPAEIGVFFRGKPVFTTSIPNFDMDRRVIARFPDEDILLSGYCEQEEKLAERTALVWLKKGKGQLVLLGFNPQFRASTPVSYKLLFNGLLL